MQILIIFILVIIVAALLFPLGLYIFNEFQPPIRHEVSVRAAWEREIHTIRAAYMLRSINFSFTANKKNKTFRFLCHVSYMFNNMKPVMGAFLINAARNELFLDTFSVITQGETGILELKGSRFISYKMTAGRSYSSLIEVCAHCKNEFAGKLDACPNCGREKVIHWICTNCYDKNLPTNRICRGCGMGK